MNNDNTKYRTIAVLILVVLFCPVLFFFIRPWISQDVIAVPALSPSYSSPVAPVFSRCTYFVIYNITTNRCIYLPNKFRNDSHEIVPYLLKNKAGVVIVKQIGPNDFQNMSLFGVKVYVCTSAATVLDAINDFRNGRLVRTDAPTGLCKVFYQK